MGILTDIFVADEQTANAYDGAPAAGIECVELGGLTNLHFETLWAFIAGEAWDVDRHALRELRGDDSSWTFQFPAAYVAALAELRSEKVSRVAADWAVAEETTPDVATSLVLQLVALAQSAARTGKGLYVWVSL